MATKLRCVHCAREWFPRTAKPKKCPGCQRRDYAEDGLAVTMYRGKKLPRLLEKQR